MSLVGDFKAFINKGDVLDLAVAFVMGAAFNALVTNLVTDIVTPLIGVAGHFDFSSIQYTFNGSTILLGAFINAIISFITIAVAIFFFVIKPMAKLNGTQKPNPPAPPDTKECSYCISKIPLKATRCPFCTSELN